MAETGDPSDYLAMTHDCEVCEETADLIVGIHEAGGYVVGGERSLANFERMSRSGDLRGWQFEVTTAPTEYVEEEGGDVLTLDGGTSTQFVELVRRGTEWSVRNHGAFA